MPKLENGQKVFVFVDFEDGKNYTKIRQDRVLELYKDNNGVNMIEFMYLPCDLPLSELDKTIFTVFTSELKALTAMLQVNWNIKVTIVIFNTCNEAFSLVTICFVLL